METRKRLITAAQKLLWERGHARTSPKDIQAAASAGQGSMYHHFHSKEDLSVAVLEVAARAMRHDAEASFSGPGTALEKLEGYLRRRRDGHHGCRIRQMTCFVGALASPALMAPVTTTRNWLLEAVADAARRSIENGELRDDIDPTTLACNAATVVRGGCPLARAHGNPSQFGAAVDGAVSTLERVAA
ncbi:TetR/AcrR family transcriptional regulator [Streptomyces smyrnaeus]|uniref:TetR/AcrR family transcriptional regulator n=1 Tax=Streptomyces smyrnaeus TaxID=1387713 RepID=A0ABS3XV29_9ACTN|nr:TetR/AcrR family transcriptional regulator [Streptomyces smyrnaeus]MBO8199264.1 TetR/AcrR family transcriptional regulator [Streptomyces smyrnaeus]